MGTHGWLTLATSVVAFLAGMVGGWTAMSLASKKKHLHTHSWLAAVPLCAGMFVSLMFIIFIAPALLSPHDRFYSVHDAMRLTAAIGCGLVLILVGYTTYSGSFFQKRKALSLLLRFGMDLLACIVIIAAGVRFSVFSPLPGKEYTLGGWAAFATLAWMLVAMSAVKLLDGLEGAASVLLLVSGVAVFYTTVNSDEHFLNAFAASLIGASLASLRFTAFPGRFSLRGPGSAAAGFLFGVLTVLARQKTVAALFCLFPLVLVVILVGGSVLSGLERAIFPGREDKR